MTKENYELYIKLQAYTKLKKDLEKSGLEYLYWYNDNIKTIVGLKYLEFDCIEDNKIWFEGCNDFDNYQESFSIEKLFLTDIERKLLAEKFKRDKMNRVREAEEKEELLRRRYIQYLKLQKEFEEEIR